MFRPPVPSTRKIIITLHLVGAEIGTAVFFPTFPFFLHRINLKQVDRNYAVRKMTHQICVDFYFKDLRTLAHELLLHSFFLSFRSHAFPLLHGFFARPLAFARLITL